MARDGSGTFTRVVTPPVNGDVANANDFNSEMDDIADALTDSINTSGTKAFAADQSMGGHKLTDLAAPSSANDAARKAYVDSAITAASQPLDATLTALAALSWSSGSPVVQFTAADTVSLTLTPSVTSVAVGAGSTGALGVKVGAEQNGLYSPAANQVALRSATGGEMRFFSGGAFMQSGAFLVVNGSASTPSLAGLNDQNTGFIWDASDGMSWVLGGTARVVATTTLFDFTTPARSRIPLSSETSGTLTAASANKKVKMSGDITINDGVFTADDFILVENNSSSSRNITQDTGMTLRVNGTATTGSRVILPYGVALISFDTNAVAIVCGAIT